MSEVVTHKCPNCDGPLLFNPSEQNFHCEYCLSIFNEREIAEFERGQENVDVKTESATNEAGEPIRFAGDSSLSDGETELEMELFSCPSCGAEIVTDLTTAATYCYYCHNPVILQGRVSGQFLPEKVLPFALEKEGAIRDFLAWTRKKKFIPKDFFDEQQIAKLTGVYFPYWVVDADLSGDLTASATKIRVWRTGNYEYTQTKTYHLRRGGKINFNNLVKNALQKNTQLTMVESVQPFKISDTVPFKSQYLAGFQAEKRDIELTEMTDELNTQFNHYAEQLLSDTMTGYATIYNKKGQIKLEKTQGAYVLLPVWLLTYQNTQGSEKEKIPYYFAMNGQTGKVSGKLPIAKGKLITYAVAVATVVLVLALIGGYFI